VKVNLKRHDLYVRYLIIKRKLFAVIFIVLIALGVIITSIGVLFYSNANPPTFSSNPYYRGLGIVENSTIIPGTMYIGLQVNPPAFSFQYFFITKVNGTYDFVFEFPFNVISKIRGTEGMSVNSTDTCTVISVSNNLTQGSGEVWGQFTVSPTFLSGSRGLYTMVLPFGNPYNSEAFQKAVSELQVSSLQPDAKIKLNIVLPHDYSWTESFPAMTGMEPFTYPLTDKPKTSLYWDFDNLQNIQGSVTVKYEDQSQIGNYANWNFLSGIFIGVGSSILTTSVYDGLKKWSEKAEKHSE
jgi:hypothetical protein